MSMAEKSKTRELFGAALTLLVILAGLGGIIWLANSCRVAPAKKLTCPYCGKEIIVRLDQNGEKKP